jgi:hypothetical protein
VCVCVNGGGYHLFNSKYLFLLFVLILVILNTVFTLMYDYLSVVVSGTVPIPCGKIK